MTPLDYAVTYAVYVLSTAGAGFILLRGWAVIIRARNDQ